LQYFVTHRHLPALTTGLSRSPGQPVLRRAAPAGRAHVAAEQQAGGYGCAGKPAEGDQQRPGLRRAVGKDCIGEEAESAAAGQELRPGGRGGVQHGVLGDAEVEERHGRYRPRSRPLGTIGPRFSRYRKLVNGPCRFAADTGAERGLPHERCFQIGVPQQGTVAVVAGLAARYAAGAVHAAPGGWPHEP